MSESSSDSCAVLHDDVATLIRIVEEREVKTVSLRKGTDSAKAHIEANNASLDPDAAHDLNARSLRYGAGCED